MTRLEHFIREHDGQHARFHLREEPDGSGVLLANAAAGARLSASGVVMARILLVHARDEPAVERELFRQFPGIERRQLRSDAQELQRLLDTLVSQGHRYPIANLEERDTSVHRRALGAPLCADLSWIPGDQSRARIRMLWEAGIPQILLVPAPDHSFDDPDLARSLVECVEHAEDLGAICGLRARASALPPAAIEALAHAGLDHLDFYFAGSEHDRLYGDGDHDRVVAAFRQARRLELCPTAVVPLTAVTLTMVGSTLAELATLHAGAITVFALAHSNEHAASPFLVASALPQAATTVEEHVDRHGLTLIWAPPVEVVAETSDSDAARLGPRVGNEATVRIGPDGAVLPSTGQARSAGTLGLDAWATIWGHEVFRMWRDVAEAPPYCSICPGLASCAGGCPRDPTTWSRSEPDA